MGGDKAPAVVLEGALHAVQQAPGTLECVLFGPEDVLREELAACSGSEALHIVHAPEVIGMAEGPVAAVKAKPHSSIHLGLAAHKQGQADAFVSAGNTGAVMAASFFVLGRLPGVSRPTLVGFFPTVRGVCFVLDVGSNVDCKPEHLVQFAQMGSIYAQRMLAIAEPTVALLNIGEEPGKGNDLVKESYALLSGRSDVRFIGNVEGRDIMRHAADVVVCDGFVGNTLLKFGEGMGDVLGQMIVQEMHRQALPAEQQQVVAQVLSQVRKRFNPDEYGGAPLLGVNGNVFIGHGSSSPRAVSRMIRTAAEAAERRLVHSLAEVLDA